MNEGVAQEGKESVAQERKEGHSSRKEEGVAQKGKGANSKCTSLQEAVVSNHKGLEPQSAPCPIGSD